MPRCSGLRTGSASRARPAAADVSLRRDLRRLRDGLGALRPHAKGEGGRLALGALCGALAVGFHLLRPWPLKWMVDGLAGAAAGPPVARWAVDTGLAGSLALAAGFVALTAGYSYATYLQVLLLNGAGNRVAFRFRSALFAHIMRQPLTFHESRDVGELLTRIVYDTSRFRRGVNAIVVMLPRTLLLFAGTIAVLLWLSPPLAAVLGIGALTAFVTMHRRGRRIVRAAKKQRRKEGAVAALVADELHAIRELQTFGHGATPAQARIAHTNAKSLAGEQKVRRLAAGISMRVELLFGLSIAVTVLLASRAGGTDLFSAGDLVLFLSYALALQQPFDEFARQASRLGRTAASASRLVKLMRRVPAIVDAPGAVQVTTLRGDIAFEGVTQRSPRRARGSRKWTLKDVWAAVPAGARVAIVGGNGAGKSSLLRLALRLSDPEAGRVLIDGRDAREYGMASLRARFSVVFQDTVLFGLSVRDNIALGNPGAPEERMLAAARQAEAHRLIEGLPEGYDTVIRRRGGAFSPGERQRLAVARALLRDGDIWLLDEPVTGLDEAGAAQLTDALLAATKGRTTLWVTHDPGLAARLDLVLALDTGRLTYFGAARDYMKGRDARVPERN